MTKKSNMNFHLKINITSLWKYTVNTARKMMVQARVK